MNASDLLVWYIEEVGTEYIFGIPGGVLEPLNIAVHNSEKLQGITTKHEQGAAFMADGYARVSHKLGVCCATAGPGATNLITGIASSFTDSVPVLALTGQVATKYFGKGAFQESSSDGINLVEMFRLVTKNSAMIASSALTGSIMRRALRSALTGRPGPVHLNLPVDVMRNEVDVELIPEDMFIPGSTCFDRARIKEAAVLLLRFKRPVILLGNGVTISRAAEEIIELAELLQIPVVTTPKAKGVFPEDHPLSLGVFGVAGTPLSEKYLLNGNVECSEKIDGLLAIGTSFNEWGTHTWDERLMPTKALIQVDIDPQELGNNFPFSVAVAGDAQIVVKELLFDIKRRLRKTIKIKEKIELRKRDLECFKSENARFFDADKMHSEAVPILPQRLMEDINNACPHDSIFFIDIGNNWAWATHYLTVKRPYSFFTALGFASMGYGASACIGGKLAEPDRPVITICGDGGFLMNGIEIATAVDYNIPVIWIILNDSQHGMIYHGKKMLNTEGGFSTRFKGVDFVKMAESVGAKGIKITKPGELNQELLNRVIESNYPTVIDVRIDPEEAPPISSRIETLEI
ncbi:MAG: thiamine pyrophosphate-binding protein [Candidatus Polarisedimenticolaceae bacterium]|nr:thiamine pyrophosphate-binding protein [Candidatus Polarisedimenticolaceae bacterium]